MNGDEKLKEKFFVKEEFIEWWAEAFAEALKKNTEQLEWLIPIEKNLSKTREKEFVHKFDKMASSILVLEEQTTGVATLSFDIFPDVSFKVPSRNPINYPFNELYLTNEAQPGKMLYLIAGGKAFSAKRNITDPIIYNVMMTLANKEYSRTLPHGTTKFSIWCQDGTPFRFAWEPEHVAIPTRPYGTVLASSCYWDDGLYLIGKTLYFASSQANKEVILHCYT